MPYIDPNDYGLKSPYKAAFASYLIKQSLQKDLASIKIRRSEIETNEPKLIDQKTKEEQPTDQKKDNILPDDFFEEYISAGVDRKKFKIGIIGGGIAGLYTALILDTIGIDFEILEASDRLGGRIRTHYFTDRKDSLKTSHDYYDVGAMRFPETPIMARTFRLFEMMDLHKQDGILPYHMHCKNEPMRYNDITAIIPQKGQKPKDPFKVSTENKGPVPNRSVKQPDDILEDAYGIFRTKIKRAVERKDEEEIELAFDYLMRHDKFSLRDYLGTVEGQDWETIHWLETIGSGTGWFDQAFTENVFESLAFEYVGDSEDKEEKYWRKRLETEKLSNKTVEMKKSEKENIMRENLEKLDLGRGMNEKCESSDPDEVEEKVKWWRVNGGTEELIHRLKAKLPAHKIYLNHQVRKISLNRDVKDFQKMQVEVENGNGKELRTYSAIINSTTLAALQKMDLINLDLPYGMKTANRSLRYDSSTKVGIKFRTPWWVTKYKIAEGGIGRTDMPLRICVYPSYKVESVDEEKEAVLLASYTWGQDAERISAHVNGYQTTDPENEKELKELMLYNLALLHTETIQPKNPDVLKEVEAARKATAEAVSKLLSELKELYITHHAYDWSKDPYSSGAFALFSPGQFSKMYPNLIRPACDSRFYIIGEAASAHHAWIVGALDSSVRALYFLLTKFGFKDERKEMIKKFGNAEEFDNNDVSGLLKIGELTETQRKNLGFETVSKLI